MKVVRTVSLIARIALMATLVLGLLWWIAHIPAFSPLLVFLAGIGMTSIHEFFGVTGVLFMLILGGIAVLSRGTRLWGVAGILYALLLPAFGLTQERLLVGELHWLIQITHLLVGIGAMYLARAIEGRYQRLNGSSDSVSVTEAPIAGAAR